MALLAGLFLLVLGLGQDPAAKTTLHGLVKDAQGRALAVPATVTLSLVRADGSYEQRTMRSGSDGSWSLALEPGCKLLELWARARGYAQGHAASGTEIVLPAGATLEGRVLDKLSHEALAGARVWAESAVFDAAGDTPSALSDAQGKFLLAGLTELELPGADGKPRRSFDLHVEARDHAQPAAGSWSLEPADAGRFRTTIELLPINCELHGVVNIAVDGAAAPISLVALIDESGSYQVAPTQTGGFYKFERVAAGRALLWAWPAAQDPEHKGQLLFARGEIQLAPGSNTNVLWLEPIAGTQLSGHARALPGAEDLHPRVLLRRGIARGLEHIYYDERFVELDTQGRFAVQDILPGHYQVELRFEPAHGAALSEPARSETEIEVGQQSAPLELAYARPLRLAGRVEGTPAELEGVLVDYQRSAGGLWTRASLRPDGTFDIDGLWPAKWKLRAQGKSGIGPEIEAGPQSALELRLRIRP